MVHQFLTVLHICQLFTLDTTGTISKLDNITNNDKLNVSATDIVLAYLDFEVINDGTANLVYQPRYYICHR